MTESSQHPSVRDSSGVPAALIEDAPVRRGLASLLWLVPILALGLSIGFAVRALQQNGPTIVIRAKHGHGIGRGDAVRYLGSEVGEVRAVVIEEGADGDAVRIEVVMRRDAAALARSGTLFWIVRPQLSLDAVSGLETIIGAQYMALHPGPYGGSAQEEFSALAAPPFADELRGSPGLEIVLEAPARYGVQAGAGISYRGVRIGSVISVGLASDASSVEMRARIRRGYAQLVRERSVFWETGGVELGVSIASGFQLDLDSLRAALIGGISMATPLEGGAAATAGSRFGLAPDPKDDWLEWAPALPVGNDLLPAGSALPRLVRATLSWGEGRVLRRRAAREGWLLVTHEGLLGPADLLTAPAGSSKGEAIVAVAGASRSLAGLESGGHVVDAGSGLRRLSIASLDDGLEAVRPQGSKASLIQQRVLLEAEDLILVRDGGRAPMAIARSRLSMQGDGMIVDPGVPLTPSWHGAAVMARSDGALAGMLLVAEGAARIVPIPSPGG